MICLCGGLITEALCSGTSNSKKPVLQSIAITQYGDYEIKAPEGVDGYNPIHVNLKDRYQAGYTDGWMKCFLNIKTITITKNGTYNAKSENLEGYNPVVVDVPDRYDEGKNEVRSHIVSKTITANGTYAATAENLEGYNPVIVNVPGEYVFPDDSSYDDFYGFVGGDTITDKTLGYGVSTETEINPNDPTRQTVRAIVVDINGNKVADLYGVNVPVGDGWKIKSMYVHNDGKVDITFLYKETKTVVYHAFSKYLVGFGSSGNQIAAKNKK